MKEKEPHPLRVAAWLVGMGLIVFFSEMHFGAEIAWIALGICLFVSALVLD